jgi:chromosome segregation ATPase
MILLGVEIGDGAAAGWSALLFVIVYAIRDYVKAGSDRKDKAASAEQAREDKKLADAKELQEKRNKLEVEAKLRELSESLDDAKRHGESCDENHKKTLELLEECKDQHEVSAKEREATNIKVAVLEERRDQTLAKVTELEDRLNKIAPNKRKTGDSGTNLGR